MIDTSIFSQMAKILMIFLDSKTQVPFQKQKNNPCLSWTIELSTFLSPVSNVLFIACCVLQISVIIEECKVIHISPYITRHEQFWYHNFESPFISMMTCNSKLYYMYYNMYHKKKTLLIYQLSLKFIKLSLVFKRYWNKCLNLIGSSPGDRSYMNINTYI